MEKRAVALDQPRAVDHQRLVKRPGKASARTAEDAWETLVEMFRRE
jgi:hypothetical protein